MSMISEKVKRMLIILNIEVYNITLAIEENIPICCNVNINSKNEYNLKKGDIVYFYIGGCGNLAGGVYFKGVCGKRRVFSKVEDLPGYDFSIDNYGEKEYIWNRDRKDTLQEYIDGRNFIEINEIKTLLPNDKLEFQGKYEDINKYINGNFENQHKLYNKPRKSNVRSCHELSSKQAEYLESLRWS